MKSSSAEYSQWEFYSGRFQAARPQCLFFGLNCPLSRTGRKSDERRVGRRPYEPNCHVITILGPSNLVSDLGPA